MVSTQELGTLLKQQGQKISEDELKEHIANLEADGEDSFDCEQFLSIMDKLMKEADTEEELVEAFKVFDRNGTGFISAAELRHVMTNINEDFTDEEPEEMIKEADLDNDGQLNF